MRSTVRTVICGFSIASSVLALPLLAGSAAAAGTATPAEATAPWALVDYQQRVCVDAASGRRSYVLVFVSGRWQAPVRIDLQGLPPASTSSSAEVSPGSSDGHTALGGVIFDIPPTPVGVYSAALRGSDGTARRSVPVTIDVKSRC